MFLGGAGVYKIKNLPQKKLTKSLQNPLPNPLVLVQCHTSSLENHLVNLCFPKNTIVKTYKIYICINLSKIFQFSSGQPGNDLPTKIRWIFDLLLTRENERVNLLILQWKTVWDSLKEILEICNFLNGVFLFKNKCLMFLRNTAIHLLENHKPAKHLQN